MTLIYSGRGHAPARGGAVCGRSCPRKPSRAGRRSSGRPRCPRLGLADGVRFADQSLADEDQTAGPLDLAVGAHPAAPPARRCKPARAPGGQKVWQGMRAPAGALKPHRGCLAEIPHHPNALAGAPTPRALFASASFHKEIDLLLKICEKAGL